MYSSNYKSHKPGFSDKIKSELKGEEKSGKSYILLALIIFLVIAFIFFIIALFGGSNGNEVKVEESGANQTESTTEEQAAPYSESQTTDEGTETTDGADTTAGQTYTVESGDTLAGLGAQFGVDWKKIAEVNNIEAPYSLTVGTKLIIPPADSTTAE